MFTLFIGNYDMEQMKAAAYGAFLSSNISNISFDNIFVDKSETGYLSYVHYLSTYLPQPN